jgi:anti-anti-sigma factor
MSDGKKKRMELKIQRDIGKVVVRLKGNLDGSNACQVESVLKQLQDLPGSCRLIFDLRGVSAFEYFGVALLAQSIRRQRDKFQQVSLIGQQLSAVNVFRRFGLESTLSDK